MVFESGAWQILLRSIYSNSREEDNRNSRYLLYTNDKQVCDMYGTINNTVQETPQINQKSFRFGVKGIEVDEQGNQDN